MVQPTLVALPPSRNNISYKVADKTDQDAFTTSVCKDMTDMQVDFPKMVIFVRTYKDCIDIYLQLKQKLGSAFTEPPGYPNVVNFRCLDMFTRVLERGYSDLVFKC